MSSTKKIFTTRVKDERSNGYRRNYEIKKYENVQRKIKNGMPVYKLNYGKYNGWFSAREMLDFKECECKYKTLTKRIMKLRNEEGQYLTLWEAISAGKLEVVNLKILDRDRKRILREKMLYDYENSVWDKLSELMPIGSLYKEAKIIQSKRIA